VISSISKKAGVFSYRSLITVYTVDSILSPTAPPTMGDREIIELINSVDCICYEEISAFRCCPNVSGFST